MEDILDSDFYRQLPENVQTVFALLRNKFNLKPGKVRLLAHEIGPFMEREEFKKSVETLERYGMLERMGDYWKLPLTNGRFYLRAKIDNE